MTVLEWLSSQLDNEVMETQMKGGQAVFTRELSWWNLCMEARRLQILSGPKQTVKAPTGKYTDTTPTTSKKD